MIASLPAFSIRARLLALTLVMLISPYAGYRYVQEMEGFLRQGFEEGLLGSARALAGALHGRAGLFPSETADAADLHAHPLASAPQLDGYAADWGALTATARPLPWSKAPQKPPARLALGRYEDHGYLLLEAPDSTPARAISSDPLSADHVVLRIIDQAQQRHHYYADTSASGPLQFFSLVRDNDGQPQLQRELRIHGIERRDNEGYRLEIRIPLMLLGPRMGITVADAHHRHERPMLRAGSAPSIHGLGVLVLPSADIAAVIAALGSTPGRRIWVFDKHRRVLARGGTLVREHALKRVPVVYRWILGDPQSVTFAQAQPVERLTNAEVGQALSGNNAIGWRDLTHTNNAHFGLFVVAAAHPVWSGQDIVGGVLVEELSQPIQTARSLALAELFTTTLLVFVLAGLPLVLFAFNLSRRLRRLLYEANSAIDHNGRVVSGIGGHHGRDEIGELAGGFAQMLDRLGQYNRYLERLASRLSHELRTPLAVIRSSLDNLELEDAPAADSEFLERARGGVHRLQRIITRMSEVTRIEEAVRESETTVIDMKRLLTGTVAAYRDTWPDIDFVLEINTAASVVGSPDLIVQAMDKLVANAIDFATPGTPITISLNAMSHDLETIASGAPASTAAVLREEHCVVRVVNVGTALPQEMGSRLFESMVSVRDRVQDRDVEPHLGLGLYIVALVAASHGGTVVARQLLEPTAVAIEMRLPLAPRSD